MITTSRNKLIGGHVTLDVKKALVSEAGKQEISVSILIYRVLSSYLRKKGHDLKELK